MPTHIGRFEIDRPLGSGSAGIVYLARDPLIDRLVAVKLLRRDLGARNAESFGKRFLREARAAGRLSHPNIVTVYDVGEDAEGGPFLAMEYVEGRSLKEIISSGVRYSPNRAAQIVASLANALDYAHRMGVVHRDIKPSNVLLTADGEVKITDFGIARLEVSDLTVEGSLMGTPMYMSPEQIGGRDADGRSDLYALGVMLFELTTGERPFTGRTLAELSVKITTQPVPDPVEYLPTMPESLSAAICRCLAKAPEERFQSGEELVSSLSTLGFAPPRSGKGKSIGLSAGASGLATVVSEPVANSTPEVGPVDTQAAVVATVDVRAGTVGGRVASLVRKGVNARLFWPVVACVGLLLAFVLGSSLRNDTSMDPAGVSLMQEEPIPLQEEARETAVELTPTPLPPVLDSTLIVTHKNRLSLAYISLWVDGSKVWTEELTAPKNVFKRVKRISGLAVEKSIPVSAGNHTIEVHISGKSKKIEARSSIQGEFQSEQVRRLKIGLNPYTKRIKMSWES